VKVVSLLPCRPPLYPRKLSCYSFLFKAGYAAGYSAAGRIMSVKVTFCHSTMKYKAITSFNIIPNSVPIIILSLDALKPVIISV
jgi:hypothetical protein